MRYSPKPLLTKTVLSFLALYVILLSGSSGCHESSTAITVPDTTRSSKTDTVTAKLAPNFELRDLAGAVHRLSDYRGTVVVLNFWATWCPPCRMEIPGFNSLQDSIGHNKVQFLGVALDDNGDSVVHAWVTSHPISYPILLPDDSVMRHYGPIDAIPLTYFIDKKGRLRSSYLGPQSKDQIMEVLNSLLSEN